MAECVKHSLPLELPEHSSGAPSAATLASIRPLQQPR